MEKEIEEKTKEFEDNIKDIQIKCDEQLQQLRNFYDIEKDKLERRLQDEKEKAQRRYNLMMEENE